MHIQCHFLYFRIPWNLGDAQLHIHAAGKAATSLLDAAYRNKAAYSGHRSISLLIGKHAGISRQYNLGINGLWERRARLHTAMYCLEES